MKLNIIRYFNGAPDTTPLLQYIIDQKPAHVHALLSGKEGQQFLQLFSGLLQSSTTGLTVNSFMAEDGLLTSIPSGLELYNASTWSVYLDSDANRSFVQAYTSAYTMIAASLISFLLLLSGRMMAGTPPSIGLIDFVNNFSASVALLGSTTSPQTVSNVGNTGETDGILASGWDISITTTGTDNVSGSVAAAGPGGAADFCIRMNSLTAGVTVNTLGLKSDDASAFSLQYVYLKLNITAGAPADILITGYLNGTAVSGATFTTSGIATATWTQINVSAIAAFRNINEFRFTQTTTSATISFEVVGQIDIAAAIVLPLTLTNFSGQRAGNSVQLGWTTASEQNTSYFDIQRGSDGSTWSTIAQVAAAGNSTKPLNYHYTDIPPAAAATWYYRLEMIDLDGQFTYSPILAIGAAPISLSFSAYPNPFGQQLTLQIGSPEPIALQEGNNVLSLPLVGRLAKGIYFVVLSMPRDKRTISIIKSE